MTEPSDDVAKQKDDSGELALAKADELEQRVNGRGGIGDHLGAVDHTLYIGKVFMAAMCAMLAVSLLVSVLGLWLTQRRSANLDRFEDQVALLVQAVGEIRASEEINQQLSRDLLATQADVAANAQLVADAVRQSQANQAGQSSGVARALVTIDRIAAQLGIDPNQPPPE